MRCLEGRNCGDKAVCGSDDRCGIPVGNPCINEGGCAAPNICISGTCSVNPNPNESSDSNMMMYVIIIIILLVICASGMFIFLRR
jgi:hypothetical protein